MKRFILSLSQTSLVLVITLIAVITANILNYIISIYFEGEFTQVDFIRSTLIPLVLAPLLSWHLVKMTFKLISVERELKSLTTYDSLTRLFSRSAFLSKSKAIFKEAKISGKPFTVLAIDLDHFKKINDNYGHCLLYTSPSPRDS